MIQDKIHINIRKCRERLGMSQARMAEELGIGRTTYVNFETGKTSVFSKTLRMFSEKTGIPEEEILLGFNPEEELRDIKDFEEGRKAIIQEYEMRIATLSDQIAASKEVIKAHELTIDTLKSTNKFLLSQLHKNN